MLIFLRERDTMKVLLFSVTAGEGHNATAKAIARSLEGMGAETRIVDAYRIAGRLMYHTVAGGYILVSSYLKYGYGVVYRMLEHRRGGSYRPSLARLSGRSLAKKFKRVIDEYDPDVIVCTHCFAARILDIVKERYGMRAKVLGVVTDFTMHPYWEEAQRIDRLIVPCKELVPLAYKKGFTDEQIRPLGIPVHPKFAITVEKEEARRILGLDQDLPTLLVMSGSMGYGNMERVLRRLDALTTHFQIIVVCGNNKKVYARIKERTWKKPVLALGYTENVPLLMDASDLIISKPGGLTTSEALTRRLPMVIVSPIPGHEDRNVEFLTEMGSAVAVSRRLSLTDAVDQLISDPARRLEMQKSIDKIRKPTAVLDLCHEVLTLAAEAENENAIEK